MKPHEEIRKELRDFPLPYTIEQRRSHAFLRVEGYPAMVISSMGTKTSLRTIKANVCRLRKIRRACLSGIDANKQDD